jgi:hypothetical protein
MPKPCHPAGLLTACMIIAAACYYHYYNQYNNNLVVLGGGAEQLAGQITSLIIDRKIPLILGTVSHACYS